MLSLIPREEIMPKFFQRPFTEDFINRMLADFTESSLSMKPYVPSFNMYREGENIVIEASTPGYKKEEIKVEIKDDMLTVSGRHQEKSEREEKDYYHHEFQSGSFSRTVRLPESFEASNLKANYQDGVLKITMPCRETEKTAQTIPVE